MTATKSKKPAAKKRPPQVKLPKAVDVVGVSTDVADKGMALTIVDAAEMAGMDLEGYLDSDKFAGASHRVVLLAKDVYRDRMDAMLWRNNWQLRQIVDQVAHSKPATAAEARSIVETVVKPANLVGPKAAKAIVANANGKPASKRIPIFGHPATKVMMWMGKQGYTPEQIAKFVASQGVSTTMGSIKVFARFGVTEERGPGATLTDEQAAKVKEIVNG